LILIVMLYAELTGKFTSNLNQGSLTRIAYDMDLDFVAFLLL